MAIHSGSKVNAGGQLNHRAPTTVAVRKFIARKGIDEVLEEPPASHDLGMELSSHMAKHIVPEHGEPKMRGIAVLPKNDANKARSFEKHFSA